MKKQTTYDSATTAIMPMMVIIKLAIIIIIITINLGNSITCSINFRYRIAAKLCTLATSFVSGV